ncbi:MAG TPA: hypothetical protein VKU79_00580 [Thermoplasmataceae archaeon]|nr:hypothetical protein [Thermoplasmataceae archaeon]
MTKIRKFVADSIGTAVFWTVIYTPIYLLASRSIDYAFLGLALSAVVEVAFGGLFGKFLDWFRKEVRASS